MEWRIRLKQCEAGVVLPLPPEVTERFQLKTGDEFVLEQTTAGLLLKKIGPDEVEVRQILNRAMWGYDNTLRTLAKS